MGWTKEMETPEYQERIRKGMEEEARHYAEYLQEKAERDFQDFVAQETKKKAVTRTA